MDYTVIDKTKKPLVHFIDRDENEKYIVFFFENDIQIYDIQGNKKQVVFVGNSKQYLTNSNPLDTLKVTSVADHTFVVNKKKTTQLADSKTADTWATQGVLVHVKSGQYGRTYKILINDTVVASVTTPDGSSASHTTMIATDYIVNQLATQATAKSYTVTVGSSWLYINKIENNNKTAINKVEVYDGFNNQAIVSIQKTAQKFSLLPSSAPNNFIVKLVGERGTSADDYYVRYDTQLGLWKETTEPNLQDTLDGDTLPHILVREADGKFTFKPAVWGKRETGDNTSNPTPSFIGQTINDIVFFRNRLGFIAGENIILSQSAQFFNFWVASAVEVQDTDPIDRAISSNSVETLQNAVLFGQDLLLFSGNTQFIMKAEGTLTPKNSVVSTLTNFANNTKVKPVGAGRNIYFATERTQYTTINEYFTAVDDTDSKDKQDITAHVPSYIPNGVYKLIPSTIENLVLALTNGAEDCLYVYKYLFIQNQKQQSSWSHWCFKGDILGASFIGSVLYLVINRGGVACLEKILFTYNTKDIPTEPYRVFLDRKVSYQVTDYNPNTDISTIQVSNVYNTNTQGSYKLITDKGVYYSSSDGVFLLVGNHRGQQVTIGLNYSTKITLSQLMIKRKSEQGTEAITEGILLLNNVVFNFSNSGVFSVIVEVPTKDKKYNYMYTGKNLGLDNATLDRINFTSGKFKVPINDKNDKVNITIETSYPHPVAFNGLSWVGRFSQRSKRI